MPNKQQFEESFNDPDRIASKAVDYVNNRIVNEKRPGATLYIYRDEIETARNIQVIPQAQLKIKEKLENDGWTVKFRHFLWWDWIEIS